MSTPDAELADVAAIVSRHRSRPGALLPALHEIQDRLGHVPQQAVPTIANILNLSRAEVHGVLSFYHDFRHQAGPKARICMGEACQSMGSAALMDAARQRLGEAAEAVYCLGNCACAPNVDLCGSYHGRVSLVRLQALLAAQEATA